MEISDITELISPTTSLADDRQGVLDAVRDYWMSTGRTAVSDDDLEIAAVALSELLNSAELFGRFPDRPKVAVFGSARITRSNPLFTMARDFSRAMSEKGWMTISGAGPGIMAAAAEGSGREHTIGVNVELPFEQGSNEFIDADTQLIAMKYFFTRKVAMTRPAQAFVIFPGGFGTLDEVFEVLTLLHTGKTSPAPVLLVDVPGGTFWGRWREFLEAELVAAGYVDQPGVEMAHFCNSAAEAVAMIESFYSNYRGFEREGDRAALRLSRIPDSAMLAELTAQFPEFTSRSGWQVSGARLEFDFDARHYSRLHQLIQRLNVI